MSNRVIGIDIGSSGVTVSEVDVKSRDRSSGVLLATATVQVPPGSVRSGVIVDPGGVAQALKTAMVNGRIKSKAAVVGIGAPSIAVREVTLPQLPLAEARRSLPLYSENVLPMPASEAVLDFYPTAVAQDEGQPSMSGLLVGVHTSAVRSVLEACEGAGLDLKAIDLSAFAMYRALSNAELDADVVGYIDVGTRVTTVTVVAQGVPRLVRYIDGGTMKIADDLAATGDVEHSEAVRLVQASDSFGVRPETLAALQGLVDGLLRSIAQTLAFYAAPSSSSLPLRHIVLTGDGTRLRGLPQALASRTGVQVTLGDLGSKISIPRSPQTQLPSACSLGLALRELP